MTGSYSESQVRLYRDALSTPWGFRLQGGSDFKAPLTVQRVFVGSPADGTLSRGDVIRSIENYDASRMIHKQAMDIVKQAGGSLVLCIRRSVSARKPPTQAAAPQQPTPYRSRPPEASAPKNPVSPGRVPEFGMDYGHSARFAPQHQASHHGLGYQHKGPPERMLDRLQRSLNSSLWQAEEGDEDYEYKAVGDLKKQFGDLERRQKVSEERERLSVKDLKSQYNYLDRKAQTLPRSKPKPTQPQRKPVSVGAGPVWQKPHPSTVISRPPAGLVEPGWTPKATPDYGWKPVQAPAPGQAAPTHYAAPPAPAPAPAPVHRPEPAHRPAPHHAGRQRPAHTRPVPGIHHIQPPDGPAWAGSLKSSGGPKPWEIREAEVISGGGPSGIPPAAQAPVNVHQPRVQTVSYGPGGTAPTYGQQAPAAHGPSDTAQVKHLQYNSPLGLYSKDNVQEVLSGQTTGKPGEGTLQVAGGPGRSFDPDRSDVLRLLQEQETIKKRGYGLHPQGAPSGGGGHSARYDDQQGEMHYQGYQDHSKKSPAMARLEYNLESGTVGVDAAVPSGEGTSDF